MFFDWSLFCASPDSGVTKQAPFCKNREQDSDERRRKNAERFHVVQEKKLSTKKNLNRCIEIIVTLHATAESRTSPKTDTAAACQLCHNNKGKSVADEARQLSLTSSNSVNHRGAKSSNLEAQPISRVWDLYRPREERGNVLRMCIHFKFDSHCARTEGPYSLGLVLTNTLRGPLLLKHCPRTTSTSEKGLRNTRSPFMVNNFFPTSRPAIL